MKVIYKYPLYAPHTTIEMPVGAKILHVHEQHDDVMLWAEVDDAETETIVREFIWIGTGNPFPGGPAVVYLGSAILRIFVWHVYEVVTPS